MCITTFHNPSWFFLWRTSYDWIHWPKKTHFLFVDEDISKLLFEGINKIHQLLVLCTPICTIKTLQILKGEKNHYIRNYNVFPFSGTENTHSVFFAKYFSGRFQFFKNFESHLLNLSSFCLFIFILLVYIGNNDVLRSPLKWFLFQPPFFLFRSVTLSSFPNITFQRLGSLKVSGMKKWQLKNYDRINDSETYASM